MFKKQEKDFLTRRNLIICPNCGDLTPLKSKTCDMCGVKFNGDAFEKTEEKSMRFLNLTEQIRRKTRFWRELMLAFAAIKLPIEVIAFFELDSMIGKLQGIGDLIFAIVLLIVSAWLVVLKRIQIKRGDFVGY